jgi:cytochrome c oxidase cbb3-type subunit 3
MTRNLSIATVFLLLSTVLLGFIWVREHSVLDARTNRFDGALLSRGARDYEQYCSSCHGLTGEGGVANGAPQINNLPNTLDGRMDGPTGILAKYGTVRNFVEATITSGVRGTAMPRWSARLGGPLRDDQIKDIAAYVSSWWGPQGGQPNISSDAAELAVSFKATSQAAALASASSNTPAGLGQVIFAGNCASCHNLTDKDSGVPAPGLGGLFGPDGTAAYGKTLPNTKPVNAANFLEWVKKGGQAFASGPLTEPAAGYGPYVIAAMPAFEAILKEEDLNNLLAFISTHDRNGEQKLPPLGPDGNPLPEQPAGTPGATPAAGTPLPNAAPGNNATPTP